MNESRSALVQGLDTRARLQRNFRLCSARGPGEAAFSPLLVYWKIHNQQGVSIRLILIDL